MTTNEGFVDLHVHTFFSDGTLSPGEVVQKAVDLKLKAVGITDHDCVNGISPAIEAAKGTGLEVIPGIEISSAIDDTEIHILGYFIDWRNSFLVELVTKMRENRVERMRQIVRLLQKEGVDISEEKVIGSVSEGVIGRPHLARIMCEKGFVRDVKEAFDRYLADGKPCHVRHKRLDYKKAIEIIMGAGGVPVLAHPGTMGKDEYIPDYVAAGIKGIEVFHSEHETADSEKYLKAAEEHGLIVTGGSDCHGTKKGRILIGKVKVGYDVVERLREEAERIRKAMP